MSRDADLSRSLKGSNLSDCEGRRRSESVFARIDRMYWLGLGFTTQAASPRGSTPQGFPQPQTRRIAMREFLIEGAGIFAIGLILLSPIAAAVHFLYP